MLLSILMIVKNEEDYLPACLEALLPLRRQIESELIIADTGSSDRTMDIARSYADQVFFFEWCDDFSAARNATLQRASGAWIMAVDADEIIEDPSDLAYFFTSGEYKSFGAATIVQRNYNKRDRRNYSDYNMLRLAQRTAQLRYVNAIHESLANFEGPICILPTLAHHDGYMLEGREEHIDKKTLLYTRLLVEELKKRPTDPSLYYYLYKSFSMYDDYEHAVECLTTGLRYAAEQNHVIRFDLFSQLAATFCRAGKFEDVLDVARDYFDSKEKPLAFDIDLYCLRGRACFKLGRFREAIGAFEAYFECLEEYRLGRYNGPEVLIYSEEYSSDFSVRDAVLKLTEAYMNEQDAASAGRCLKSVPDELWPNDTEHLRMKTALGIEIMIALSDFSELPGLYACADPQSTERLEDYLEDGLRDAVNRGRLLGAFGDGGGRKTAYALLMRLRQTYFAGGSLGPDDILAFISAAGEWKPLYADVLYMALDAGCLHCLLSSEIDPADLDRLLFASPYLHFDDLPELLDCLSGKGRGSDDPGELNWLAGLCHGALCGCWYPPDRTAGLLASYAGFAAAYIEETDGVPADSEGKAGGMTKHLKTGWHCALALQSQDAETKRAHLKAAAACSPALAPALELLA